MDIYNVGYGHEDVLLTNSSGRIRLDGDELGQVIDWLVSDPLCSEWVRQAQFVKPKLKEK